MRHNFLSTIIELLKSCFHRLAPVMLILAWDSASVAETDVTLHLIPLPSPSAFDTTTTLPSPMDRVDLGASFVLELWVSDVGSENTGIVGLYADLTFESEIVRADVLTHSDLFGVLREGVIDETSGQVVNFGGCSYDPQGIEPEWARLGTVECTALSNGTWNVTSQRGLGGVGVFGRMPPTDDEIHWGSASVASALWLPTHVRAVRHDAPDGGDGRSWFTAFRNLQAALDDARSDLSIRQIWVGAGTYMPDRGTDNRSATFELVDAVEVFGGFAGHEEELDERDWFANETILSGEIGTSAPEDNSFHVVTATSVDRQTRLDGLVILSAYADGLDGDGHGGGILCMQASPTIWNCRVRRNHAAASGGGICVVDGDAQLLNCTLMENSADTEGGGIVQIGNGVSEVINCTLTRNSAGIGSAIAAPSGSVSVANTIIWRNPGGSVSGNVVVRNADIDGWWPGAGNICADPLFDDASGRLQPGSPCIDAGASSAVPIGIETDLGGAPRFHNDIGTPDRGRGMPPVVDMGAFEFQADSTGHVFSLDVSPLPLRARRSATFATEAGRPGTWTYLAYSLVGTGTTYVPMLNATIDLRQATQAGDRVMADGTGVAIWHLFIPGAARGRDVWFQAAQVERRTIVVTTWIE